MHRFRATLYKIGFLRCVDVPPAVSRALCAETTMPVRGHAAGVAFRSTLLPRGQRAHRLFVHSRVWRTRRIDVGDSIDVALERDDAPRAIALPADLRRALADRPAARVAYERAPVSLRREIGNWLAAAKRGETRERRLDDALTRLEARAARSKPIGARGPRR